MRKKIKLTLFFKLKEIRDRWKRSKEKRERERERERERVLDRKEKII